MSHSIPTTCCQSIPQFIKVSTIYLKVNHCILRYKWYLVKGIPAVYCHGGGSAGRRHEAIFPSGNPRSPALQPFPCIPLSSLLHPFLHFLLLPFPPFPFTKVFNIHWVTCNHIFSPPDVHFVCQEKVWLSVLNLHGVLIN